MKIKNPNYHKKHSYETLDDALKECGGDFARAETFMKAQETQKEMNTISQNRAEGK